MNNAMRPRQDKEHTKDLTARFGRGCYQVNSSCTTESSCDVSKHLRRAVRSSERWS
jgi:hypothetical protein